jgi:hypothetical protein
MKRSFTLILFILLGGFSLNAQSQRIVLIEHFTQASCPPCASINPQIRPTVVANEDKIAIIHHQVNWPGFDPMNEQNPGDVRSRVDYYRVTGVPSAVLDGAAPTNPLNAVTQANIDRVHAQVSKMSLDLQVDAKPAFDGLTIDLNITADAAVSGNLVAHVVVVEEEINFSSPPGSNGERVFHHVMKKHLPNALGTDIADDWSAGQTETLSFDYDFENFYDWQQAGVVAFVQNRSTKEIIQAVHWKPAFEPNDGDDVLVQAANAAGTFGQDFVCGNTTEPIITVMNGGTAALSGFDVEYSINGGATQTYNWTGSPMASFETRNITLPSIGFSIAEIGELSVNAIRPNGVEDAVPSNGQLTSEFLPSPSTTLESEFRIRPLSRPADLSFKITDDAGNVILEDGPFSSGGWMEYPLSLDENMCYSIQVVNRSGNVNGTYQVYNSQDERILNGVVTGQGTFVTDFGTFPAVSNNDLTEVAGWQIQPNPSVGEVFLTAEVAENVNVRIQVMDLLGKVHVSMDRDWTVGSQSEYFDLSDLSNGIYLVSISAGDKMTTKRVIKQ